MTNTESTDIKFAPIAESIGTRLLKVPVYQRSYAWEAEHIAQYFDDIKDAMLDKEQEYFLGSVVSTKGEEREEVVDGQQRLATTVILLSAVRDFFASAGDVERASQIEAEYLFRKDLRTQETVPRLQLNDTDNDYFIRRILARPNDPDRATTPTKPSHERINEAAVLAEKYVAVLTKGKDARDRLADLVDYLKLNVRVIWLRAADTANAFVIFETLNDRGLDLAISDLLKNYLFLLSENRISEVQSSWTSMLASLENTAGDARVTDYLRHMWSSHYGATRERELYGAIKKKIVTKSDAVQLAKDLEAGAGLYAAMLNVDHPAWKSYGSSTREHMGTINTLGMVQIRPLLLAVLETFAVSEVKVALRNMVSWGVRLLIVGGLGGGVMEDHYSDAARRVRKKEIKNAAALRAALSKVIPNDAVFQESFSIARVSKSALARYYLRALEKSAQGGEQPELVPNVNSDEINLEHILPRTKPKNWAFDEDEHRAYVTRIGNLALMQRTENEDLGASGFSEKRAALKKSQYKLTAMIAKDAQWTPTTINARQNKLAQLAVKTWPLK